MSSPRRRAAVAGVAVGSLGALFFAIEQAVSFLLPVHGWAPAILAGAGVSLCIWPAHHLAHRFVDTWFRPAADPGAARLRAVYEAAWLGAAVGGVTRLEQKALRRLAADLGLEPGEAAAVEAAQTAQKAPPASPSGRGTGPSAGGGRRRTRGPG